MTLAAAALVGVLTPDQFDTLLKALNETKGAEISNMSQATGRDGERMGFGFSKDDGQGAGALMGIDLYPKITSDGQAVDLALTPSSGEYKHTHP